MQIGQCKLVNANCSRIHERDNNNNMKTINNQQQQHNSPACSESIPPFVVWMEPWRLYRHSQRCIVINTSMQETRNRRQQTTDNRQQTTDNRHIPIRREQSRLKSLVDCCVQTWLLLLSNNENENENEIESNCDFVRFARTDFLLLTCHRRSTNNKTSNCHRHRHRSTATATATVTAMVNC